MGITNSNKELSTMRINCKDSFQVKLSLTAAPDIETNPTDIVLILDRSGSMAGNALANLKIGAKAFIDIIAEATGGMNGQIGSGSRIAVVSFADTATQDTQLITSVSDLKSAVDALTADGDTNHADAFTKASELLTPPSSNAKVMVMFTDGKTTTGADPSPVAAAARTAGTIIYCIGLSGNDGIDVDTLEDWASKPASSYVAITPDAAELEEIFAELARNISKPGATNIVLTDRISPCFRITAVSMPSKGTASLIDATSVQWKIDELGVNQSEGAELEFTVKHVGSCSGTVEVNESISYSDTEGNTVTFPSPKLEVDCDVVVNPETCPEPVELSVDGCEDTVELDAGKLDMDSLGRIAKLDITVRNVCPNKRVALAAILTEVDCEGIEHKRGLKTMVVPAHTNETCRDVIVRGIKFVLPESLDVSGATCSICNERNFKARFIAHYIDNNFECCDNMENGCCK
ncbi:MAG: VWA domain-containing protein [Oscillospiraceae bacterium]|nr:VWA domain-containing protein [Oscillospiraceae bacterium]